MLAGSADRIFGYAGPLVALDSWLGVMAFAGQIFFDFAGYSICAIGAALCLGFHLKDNFRFPTPPSVSPIFGDAGTSRFPLSCAITFTFRSAEIGQPVARAINLVIVMFLGGLWHGAAWTFVVWGLLHGFYLVIERVLRGSVGNKGGPIRSRSSFSLGLATYAAVCIAWVFFRASDFTVASAHAWGNVRRARRTVTPFWPLAKSSGRDRYRLDDPRALGVARDQHRNGRVAFAALGRDRGLGSSWLAPSFLLKETAMPSSTSNFKEASAAALFFATGPAKSVPRDFERPIPQCRGAAWPLLSSLVVIAGGRRLGVLLPLDRLWSHPQRQRGSLGNGAPARATRVDCYRRRFARLVRSRSRRIAKGSGQTSGATRGSRAVALIRYWPISRMTKLFTAPLFAVSPHAYSWRHLALLQWSARKKTSGRSHTQTPAQRASQYLAMPLEEHVAFLKQRRSRPLRSF